MGLWLLILVVMLSEFGLHYFPWKKFLMGRELPRVAAYTLGVLGLMLPFTAWLYERCEVEVIQTLWIVIFSGGLTVLALYGLDRYCELSIRDVEATERETVLRDRDAKK